MRILFATSEAHPLIKTGGLADVSGALPKALSQLKTISKTGTANIDIKIVLPAYSAVLTKLKHIKDIARSLFKQRIEHPIRSSWWEL